MDILLKVSWEMRKTSHMEPSDVHRASSCWHPAPLLTPPDLLCNPAFPFHSPAYGSKSNKNPNPVDGRMQTIGSSSDSPLGTSAPPALMRWLGGNVSLGGLRQARVRSALGWQEWERAGKCDSHGTVHHPTLNVWEEGGIKKCFPTPILLNHIAK